MKKAIILLILLSLSGWASQEVKAQQGEGTYLVSGSLDLVKTDLPGVIRRYQFGTELNYFHWYFLSFSGGYEFNYNRSNHVTLGSRYYPADPVFIRVRGLVGKDSDLALGAGYSYNVTYRLRLEGMVDYYAISQVAGLRAGVSFLIN